MNNRIVFIIFFVSQSLLSFAQLDSLSKKKENPWSFNISILNSPDFSFKNGVLLTTPLGLKINKSLLQLSPLWWFDKNRDANFFRGGIFSYSYYPFKEKDLSFYFIYDLVYEFKTEDWSREIKYNPTSFSIVDYNSKAQSLKNQIGYGFSFIVLKRVYINQSFSIGGEFYNYQSNTTVRENAAYSSEYKSGSLFNKFQACYFLKTGVSYCFE